MLGLFILYPVCPCITDLSLHGKPLQDFVFWCHLGVVLSKTSVNEFAGLALLFVFLQEGFFSLQIKKQELHMISVQSFSGKHTHKAMTTYKSYTFVLLECNKLINQSDLMQQKHHKSKIRSNI